MREVGYLFERFPSFGQTFCYREVAELERLGQKVRIFSIRRPVDEPAQDWDPRLVDRIEYLPEEAALVAEVTRLLRKEKSASEAARWIGEWGRQPDFLRLSQAAWIGSRLQRAGITRVHAHFAGMAARTAYWIRKFFGIRYSFTGHANDIFAPRAFAVDLEKLMHDAADVVGVSEFGANFLRNAYPDDAGKVHCIYNGVDLTAFPPATFESLPPSIISVGRLIEKKGFGDLIAACAVLRKEGCKFNCDIVGEGPLEGALRVQIAKLGLTESVRLRGPEAQHQIAERLRAATVFALPCRTEEGGGMDNLPTVIMEAMAVRLPVVSTPVAGVPEMVQNARTGLLVPAGDATALAGALRALIEDTALARRYGKCGRELAEERFSIERSARALIHLFDQDV